MKLSKKSIEWAFAHLLKENDTDLFPEPLEIEIMHCKRDDIIARLQNLDIGAYEWKPFRRFLVPKGELSYRMITQLNPLDSLVLSAIIYEFGSKIEEKRVPESEKCVFSYRFAPDEDGTLYSRADSWKDFWETNLENARNCGCIACLDISDFYNQIYHHTLENMMIYAGIPKEIIKSVMRLLEYLTQKMSRGLPVGPHAAHLLAEMSLIPIDDSLHVHGIHYCRYADDIIVFAENEVDARTKIYKIAEILDQNQRLMLQRQKTRLLGKTEFLEYATQMIADNPLNIEETEMLEVIGRYSDNNPYVKISHSSLTTPEKQIFSKEKVETLIEKYITPMYPDYPRLRWLFRRFAQIGTPSAIDYCIENMNDLIPAISDVCQYFISAADSYDGSWEHLGICAISLMRSDLFESSEFFQITLLNLFVKNTKMDHITELIAMYHMSSENIRREIIFCAYKNNAVAFIRELKEQYPAMQEWTKRAYLIACSILVPEERKYFLKYAASSLPQTSYLEKALIDWAMEQ